MTRAQLAVVSLLAALSSVAAAEYRWPDDAGIIDVKRDFGARGDGTTDDTAALKKAIQSALKGDYRNPRMVYLPAGIYLVSEPLKARTTDGPEDGSEWCNGWRSGLFLCGQNRETTTIRLKDACPGFTDRSKPQPLIITGSTGHGQGHDRRKGGFGNEAFQNTLMNFTVDTGKGNPGASGVDFLASNRGTMEDITVRSGDGGGYCGLDLGRAWPGPALIKNVSVEGFEIGLRQKSMDCSMTYEHLAFTKQSVCAIFAEGQPVMSLRGIVSRNAVPGLLIDGGSAIIGVLDSTFTWTGQGEAPPAIVGDCHLVLRNVTSEGHGVLLAKPAAAKGKGRKSEGLPEAGEAVLKVDGGRGVKSWYAMKPATHLHPGPDEVPMLPVKETPLFHECDFAKWANPRKFAVGSRTAGIQEAIDSGAEIVYLPNGHYHIEEPVILRGKLRKLIGCEARIDTGDMRGIAFVFAGVESGTVILEHLGGGKVVHDCAQTLVIRKSDLSYENTLRGTGDVFLEDGMFGQPAIRFPQHLWARQLNSEFSDRPEFTNRHGKAWVLGMKVEGEPQAILNLGGITEVWVLYAMCSSGKGPWIDNREGWLAFTGREGGQKLHAVRLKDTWDGVTKQTGGPREVGLFIGGQRFDPGDEQVAPPGTAEVKAVSSRRIELRWGAAPAPKTGLAYYRIHRDGKPLAGVEADQTSFVDETCAEGRTYAYEISAVSLRGGVSPVVKASANTPADTDPPKVLEAGAWPGEPAVVIIDFGEPIDQESAARPDSWAITPAATVKEARLNAAGDRAILRLDRPLTDGERVSIAMPGLKDRSKAGLKPAAPAAFTAWERGDGLKAEYWNARASFEGLPVLTRTERRLEYWWGDDSPGPKVNADDFTVRWTGFLRPKVSGKHVLYLRAMNGKRLTLDGKILIDRWDGNGGPEESSCEVELEAGKRYPLAIELWNGKGGAGLRFYWNQPGVKDAEKQFGISRSVVTDEYLFGPVKK